MRGRRSLDGSAVRAAGGAVLSLGAVLGELYCVTTAGPVRLNCTTVVGEGERL